MLRPASTLAVLLALVVSTGCHRQRDPKSAAGEDTASSSSETPEAPAGAGTTAVEVAPEIRDACGLASTHAYFAYNTATLRPNEDTALRKIADCFRDGPLAGKTAILVGHADPRGDDEYNMVLGSRRAHSVTQALVERGLARGQVQTTSRGELDARGSDESGWAKDRKVHVELAH